MPLCRSLIGPEELSAASRALVGFVVWYLTQLCLALLLGAAGHLHLGAILLVEVAAFVGGLALARGHPHPRTSSPSPTSGGEPAGGIVIFTLAVVALSLFIRLASIPITDYDSLAYHLPTMARWYRAHALVLGPEQMGRFAQQLARYPSGWELICTIFLLPFREDFLVALPNLAAWVVLGLATHLLAVEVGARPIEALTAALLLLAMPITRKQVDTMHVDLPLGALFVAGVYFGFAYRRTGMPLFRALGVTTAGMLAGIKTTGLLYGVFLLPMLIPSRRPGASGADRWRSLPFAMAGLIAGGFWYARNLIQVGNPLGHVRVGFGTHTLFPGFVDPAWLSRTTLASVFDPTRAAHWSILAEAVRDELGLPFLILVLSALAVPAREGVSRRLAAVAGLAGLAFVVYCTTPFSGTRMPPPRESFSVWTEQAFRYAFPFLGILASVSAVGMGALPGRGAAISSVFALVVLAGVMNWATACALVFVVGTLVSRHLLRRIEPRRGAAVASLLICLVLLAGTRWLRLRRDRERVREYGGAGDFISAHLARDESVASVLSHRSYLFYGKDFRNEVVYPSGGASQDQWLADLRRARVALVAIGPLRPGWRTRPELAWISVPGGRFVRVYGADATREPVVYRFAPAGTEPPA